MEKRKNVYTAIDLKRLYIKVAKIAIWKPRKEGGEAATLLITCAPKIGRERFWVFIPDKRRVEVKM